MNTLDYIVKTTERLVNIPSPSGFTKKVMDFVKEEARAFGYACSMSRKGGLIIRVDGRQEETIGLSAHVDTLGAMVRSINSDGTLQFTMVGGYIPCIVWRAAIAKFIPGQFGLYGNYIN